MTESRAKHYARMEGLLAEVMEQVADTLPVDLVAELEEWIHDVDEFAVATEILSWSLASHQIPIGQPTLDLIQQLVSEMHLDSDNVERLRPLVVANSGIAGDDSREARPSND